MAHDDAVTELARGAGSQFDPRVVEALLGHLGRPAPPEPRPADDRLAAPGGRRRSTSPASTSTARGTSGWSSHQVGQRLQRAGSSWASIATAARAAAGRPGLGAP